MDDIGELLQQAGDSLKKKSEKKNQDPALLGKKQPQAIEMELAVLGAVMLEKDALPRIIEILRPEMFYKSAHTDIFEAVLNLFRNSDPVDILTVSNELRTNGKLNTVGGAAYLAELTSYVASAANIEYHARVIAQKYIQREIIRITGEIQRDAFDETTDVFDLLDRAEQSFFALSETNLRRNASAINELLLKSLKRLHELSERGEGITGISSGLHALDEMTAGWQNSDLVIIAARPAMGKTAFALTITRNAAVLKNTPVAFFSLEMAATQIAQRLLFSEAEIEATKGRTGDLSPQDWDKINASIQVLSKAPIYIDDTPALSIMDLRAKARRLKAEKGIGMIIIDYLQLMRGDTRSGNREQEIAGISRALKELAKELDIPVLALAQLSRAVETRGGDKKPVLSDLRESGSIEQDADMVMFLYRAQYYGFETFEDGSSTENVGEVIIGKQRNGPVGEVKLSFFNHFAKFKNLDEFSSNSFHSGIPMQTIQPSSKFDTNNTSSTITLQSSLNKDTFDDTYEEFDVPF